MACSDFCTLVSAFFSFFIFLCGKQRCYTGDNEGLCITGRRNKTDCTKFLSA
uniref:Uncharacterized protein n=1 Tax=Anguilla anguilla TaxID=7936 RepID=A0A0E9SSN4_ANGAN